MLKPKSFHVPGALLIEQHIVKDGPSPYFVAWKPHTSRLFYDRKEMMRWIKWPKGTPTREAIDAFLDGLEAPKAQPALDLEAIKREGFGPEAHALDDSDPNSQTRTVI
jgi:hypothetical protein